MIRSRVGAITSRRSRFGTDRALKRGDPIDHEATVGADGESGGPAELCVLAAGRHREHVTSTVSAARAIEGQRDVAREHFGTDIERVAWEMINVAQARDAGGAN